MSLPRETGAGNGSERGAARLAHQSGGLGVGGSNPLAPTNFSTTQRRSDYTADKSRAKSRANPFFASFWRWRNAAEGTHQWESCRPRDNRYPVISTLSQRIQAPSLFCEIIRATPFIFYKRLSRRCGASEF